MDDEVKCEVEVVEVVEVLEEASPQPEETQLQHPNNEFLDDMVKVNQLTKEVS
jgi:hypothetical protein